MDLKTVTEYIKLYKLSLEQDVEDIKNDVPIPDDEYFEADLWYIGAIDTCNHLLEYINER